MSKTTMRKGKQDDKFSLAIREIQAQNPANKRCFDCEQRGPTYVNMTIGSYVCAKCSGMLRGINPPHRIKSISMSSFTSEEVEMVRSKGNAWCTAVWLGTYQKSAMPIDFKDDEKIKEFIIAKYEKKRYHLEPSQANFSLVNQPPALGSTTSLHSTTGSVDSHSSHHKLSSSSLIGSTLKARVDPGSQVNISVSRPVSTAAAPALVSRPVVVQEESGSQGKGSPVAAVATTATSNGHSTVTHQQFSASKPFSSSSAEPFANFADFDTAAFDSLPADPLGNPPTTTLPPMNRKSSTGLVSVPAPAKEQTISASDRYSALKELDDLFKTSTISPGPDPTAVPDIFSSSTQEPNIFSSSTEPNLFSTSNPATIPVFGVPDTQHNGSPGWAGQGWGGRSSSPALTQWTNTSSQAASTPPMWTPQWGNTDTNNSNVGWPDSNQKQLGPPVSSHSTNPFGTSPSNPPPSQFYSSDNNNDLFAAAPKPFISEKPGLMESGGNPWTGTGNGVAAFTANMTPAPNPNNPFL
eukprot:GFUD01045648.1.p1 GENE.GFUD01045648.1~~GFUD01045648.1.p1  ORF type:complete len:522 (-),score=138.49 GFUD01045648.1:1002-2567(-)